MEATPQDVTTTCAICTPAAASQPVIGTVSVFSHELSLVGIATTHRHASDMHHWSSSLHHHRECHCLSVHIPKSSVQPLCGGPVPSQPKSKGAGGADAGNDQTTEILNAILPPREINDGEKLWIQAVSSTPATRPDVITFQEQLDVRLQQRQARETGICPVRRELYTQAFDELIRQVSINCVERGLILLRVRDELRMTIAAYETLYESSIAFGIRKALQAEHGKGEMEAKILDLEQKNKELEHSGNELRAQCEAIGRQETERRQVDEKNHNEEVQFLMRSKQQLKAQLEGIISKK
uniref:33 kDa inner dynein arm light chain, axonemal-like n=1 Tax=Myxine glutinosa TaxID=7769 RepID=UPI003590200C